MFITKAYAQATESLSELEGQIPALPEAPSAGELIFQNLIVVGILVLLFYVLLIMPQQKRFKEHSKMLNALKKGDRVITSGGLIGTVETIVEGSDEIVINLGEVKVTALRSTIQQKNDVRLKDKPAAKTDTKTEAKADAKPAKVAVVEKAKVDESGAVKKTVAKKPAAKKTSAKKTTAKKPS